MLKFRAFPISAHIVYMSGTKSNEGAAIPCTSHLKISSSSSSLVCLDSASWVALSTNLLRVADLGGGLADRFRPLRD